MEEGTACTHGKEKEMKRIPNGVLTFLGGGVELVVLGRVVHVASLEEATSAPVTNFQVLDTTTVHQFVRDIWLTYNHGLVAVFIVGEGCW